MNTLEFFQRVLPLTGMYVSLIINKKAPKQHFFATIEELAQYTIEADKRRDNIYYAISSFRDNSSRKQTNVQATKVICLDVDCGTSKPYATQKEGLLATLKFVQDTQLPEPMIVSSGNGLHVYWVLTHELPPSEWLPIATAMKVATQDKGFNVDPAVPADSARVLRAIATHNVKGGKEVRLLVDRAPVSLEVMTHCLARYISNKPTLLQNLAVKPNFPPAQADYIVSKCAQVGAAVKNQKDVSEPLWYALMGIAAFCEDSDNVAIKWSQEHPEFDQAKVLKKVAQWRAATTGPTTCAKFEAENPKLCSKCRLKNKITSPCQLGIQYQETTIDQTAPDPVAFAVEIPKPFKRTTNGIKMLVDKTDVNVCPFDIYPVGYGMDEGLGYETVRFHWNRPHVGWQELSFRQAYLVDGSREFPTVIADQGIVLRTKSQTEVFQLMLRSYMDKLRELRSMTNLYSSMGWKDNFNQFVIGNTLFKRSDDGGVIQENVSLASSAGRTSHDLFSTKGTVEDWVSFTALLQKLDLPIHQFCLGVSMSAPLYAFTGLKGGTVSLYGNTGGGKSIAQLWMQSVWGDPEQLHYTSKFTQNAVYARMAFLNNLPMTIDEATLLSVDFIGDFIYTLTQGRDKARLKANTEERIAKTWALPTVFSTNVSLNTKLFSSGFATSAQLARLLEFEVPVNPVFRQNSMGGRKIYHYLQEHFGVVGRKLIEIYMSYDEAGMRAIIDTTMSKFKRKFNASFTGTERYWEQIIVLAYLGLRIAEENNLVQFDAEAPVHYILKQLGMIRQAHKENYKDALDLLTEYVNEFAAESITMMYTAGNSKPVIDYNRIPHNSLYIRYNVYRKNINAEFSSGQIIINTVHFKNWLSSKNADFHTFMRDITMAGVNLTPNGDTRYSLGKDTPIKTGQVYTIRINMQHPRLESMLGKATEDAKEVDVAQLLSLVPSPK